VDLTIRDWMIVLGAGLILLVLADALRRIYADRRSEVRLNAKIARTDEEAAPEDEFNLLAELPNGGARIVSREDLQPLATPSEDGDAEDPGQPSGYSWNPQLAEDVAGTQPTSPDSAEISTLPTDRQGGEGGMPSFSAIAPEAQISPIKEAHPPSDDADPDAAPETLDWLEALEVPDPEPEPEARLPRAVDPHVFVLNVVARSEHGFSGADILGVLLACDLRFGDMDFFHRHEQSAGRGPIQFSVCNMMRPGVFDIDAMNTLQTRGLMFFVTLPGPEDMLKAFDYMYETAKAVAKNLEGDVLDETRSAITRQSLEHMRQQIRELERRLLMQGRA